MRQKSSIEEKQKRLREKIKENSSFNAQFCINAFGIETVSINNIDYSVEDF